jgi:hypothetical protein
VHSLVDANVEHGKRLTSRPDQERPLAAELLSKSHETNGSDDNLDNAVDASSEETRGPTSEADLLEDLGGIVVDPRMVSMSSE